MLPVRLWELEMDPPIACWEDTRDVITAGLGMPETDGYLVCLSPVPCRLGTTATGWI